jgi:Ca-activated chloride channel family protein
MTWTEPLYLLLGLLAVPTFFLARLTPGRVRFSSLRVLPRHAGTWRTMLAWVPDALLALSILVLAIAMAGPRRGEKDARIHRQGIAIAMAVDTSSSMAALDLSDRGREKTRLDAIKRVFEDFVLGRGSLDGRPDDAIGVVSFARYADTRAPLTLDHSSLIAAERAIELTPPRSEDDGTAIGDGLALAVERLQASPAKSKVVILLTDGEDNASQVKPDEAAQMAHDAGVKVYTIGAGTEGVAPMRIGDPMTGDSQLVQVPVHIDEDLLRKIAADTGGKYFRADSADALRGIYGEIDHLERTDLQETRFYDYEEYFDRLVALGLVLAVLALALRATLFRRLP